MEKFQDILLNGKKQSTKEQAYAMNFLKKKTNVQLLSWIRKKSHLWEDKMTNSSGYLLA